MSSRALALSSSFALVLSGWLARAQAQSDWGGLFFRHVAGDVVTARVTPDGTRVVFLADLDADDQFELFSMPTDGSAGPVQLNAALPAAGDVTDRFMIAPDGEHVAWLADGETNGVQELYCAPVDGSAASVRVSASAAVQSALDFQFTPDSTRLVFEGRTSADRDQLWCVALDGTGALQVSGSMAAGGNTLGTYVISPDSTRIVYLADAVTDGVSELFGARLDGTVPVVKLTPTPPANANVQDYALTPDGTRLVFRGDLTTFHVFELYSVPIDGSAAAVRISRPPSANADVEPGFAFTPAGDVVYRADHDDDNSPGLYRAPADGSTSPLQLTPTLGPDATCEDFVVAASGYVVYRADQDTVNVMELYSVPLDGSRTTHKLSGAMVNGGDVQTRYGVSPDGTRVVYRADQATDNAIELYGAPVDGSAAAVRLNPALPPGRSVPNGTPIDPSGTRVLFTADVAGDNQAELLVAPLDGSSAAYALNDQGLAFPPSVDGSFAFAAGGTVVYRGVLDATDLDFVEELFRVPLDASAAPIVLNPLPALGSLDGDILSYRLTHGGERVAYVAREKQDRGLYVAPLSSPASPLRLIGAAIVDPGFAIGSDDQRAAYTAFNTFSHELFTVLLDASAAPVKLSGTLIHSGDVQSDFAFSADASRLVYCADAVEDGRFELFSVPADGSAAATQLCGALVTNGDVTSFSISPDSARVVYLADQDLDTRPELYSVPIDGSSAPIKLNGALPLSCQVRIDYRIHPDGSRVFYRADQNVLARAELYSVPIDGSAPPTRLNGTIAPGGSVFDYKLDAAGDRIVYSARQDVSFATELYSAPSDGSTAPVKLNPPLVNQGNVGGYFVSDDGALVAFDGQVAIRFVNEVWTVPADGSAPAIRVHEPLSGQNDAGLWAFARDGSHVVFERTTGPGTPVNLYTAPSDASSPPVALHPPTVQGRSVLELVVSPDSSRILYRADHDQNDMVELYSAPIDGSSMAVKISGALVPGGGVQTPLTFAPDSSSVLFLADKVADEVYELFVVPLGGGTQPLRVHPPLADDRRTPAVTPPAHTKSAGRPAGTVTTVH